ncbi:MAG: Eco57I restriction-modification methylase domain-containing protein [Candidatus Heimdallarchaeota archaeon]|nr:MAG: Eco57I restriction-modification methylase domain-containing protein [Candidatus Heimdallarchaeota archaeon]
MKSTMEEFYLLYRNIWKYLHQNTSGFLDEAIKKEFVHSFLLQMLLLWFVQRRKFFNRDSNYFLTKFKEINTGNSSFVNYFDFIIYFLKKLNLNKKNRYFKNKTLGKIVIPEPVIIFDYMNNLNEIFIPDECFYDEKFSLQLVDYLSSKGKIRDFPLLNVFENYLVNFDGFVLSGIYENFFTQVEKKNFGSYYTPEKITSYICKTTIDSYLFDRVNAKFNTNFKTINSIIRFHDVRIVKYLLFQLQDLKILDPAAGSAHLLESVLQRLMEIYKRIWRDSKKEILIETLKDENDASLHRFFEISSEDDFKLSVMHSILSNNIFGVDTDPDVLKIAKARLYLLLIKNLNKHSNLLQDLPLVKLNLKEGNTLLGYIQFKRDRSTKQLKLESYLMKNNTKANLESLTIDTNLLEYIKESYKVLKIEGQVEKELENLNLIFFQDKIDELSINQVLRTKEKINRIIHSSGDFSSSLQDFLIRITAQVNSILDQKFSEDHPIDLFQLKKVKTFHWINEFPEIFLNAGGFNIVIANPPYLGESGNKELFRIYAKALPEYYEGKMDLWYLFLQRCLDLMLPNAFSSFITSSYWVTATGAAKLRTRILSDTFIMKYINFQENKVFDTAQGVHINLITFKKARKTNDDIECVLFENTYPQVTNLIKKLDAQRTFMTKQEELIFEDWDGYFHFFPKQIRLIIKQIIKNSSMLKTSGFYVKEGIVTGLNNITGRQIKKYRLSDEWMGLGVFILNSENPSDLNIIESFSQEEKIHLKNFYKNSDISRYHTAIQTKKSILYLNRNTVNLDMLPKIKRHLQKFREILQESLDNPPYINRPRTQDIFTSPKIITPQRSLRNTFAYNSFDWYAAQDVYYILNDKNDKGKLKSLLLILNSKLAYFWFFWMGKRKGKHLELFGEPLSYFPIPTDFKAIPLFIELCEYLLFLHSIKPKEKRFQHITTYFETHIVDSLVYELYLKESFRENTIHQSRVSLLEFLSRMISSIEFTRWEKLHYKENSGEELSNEEKDQLKTLEIHNLEIIEKLYALLKEDKLVKDLITQIKAFSYVNIIEKGFS